MKNEFPVEPLLRVADSLDLAGAKAVCWPGDDGGWKVGKVLGFADTAEPILRWLKDSTENPEKLFCALLVRESHTQAEKFVRASALQPYPASPIPDPSRRECD